MTWDKSDVFGVRHSLRLYSSSFMCLDDMFYDIVFLATNAFCILNVSTCYDYDL
jgi:hypothetical protein